jgi:protein-L-isoaspartate(D-aspartate) O-methyltransferase
LEKAAWERLIGDLTIQAKLSPKTAKAMLQVPRSKFLPQDLQPYSAKDTPLQIGFGQTVPAPRMVSTINEALCLEVGNKVLEVGTGSGWHAATIAELVAPKDAPRSEWGHVYTLEIVQTLADLARKNIMNNGFGDRVNVICADGSKGYAQKAPYDRILVSAAPEVPKQLLDQLKHGDVMVIPIGEVTLFQTLMRLTKGEDGKVKREKLGEVAFAPLKST